MNDKKRLKFEERLKTIIGGYCWSQDGGNGGYEFGDIAKHIDESINQAVAEERARIVGEIEKMKIIIRIGHVGNDTSKAYDMGQNQGYNQALNSLLSSLNKPVTDKE